MAKIFLSYNRQSQVIAKTLAEDIKALGHTAWFDQELTGGQVWWDQILARVRDCDVFVFLLDPKALKSTACQREYAYAADLGKPILPILVAEDVSTNRLPPALSEIQFVDYRKQDRDALLRLLRALAAIPPAKPLPDPLPEPPAVPISYLGSLAQQIESTLSLDYSKQSTLLLDLKRGLRDRETFDDVRNLLVELRKRPDLLASIAREIDELLGTPREKLIEATEPGSEPAEEAPTPGPAVTGRLSEEEVVARDKTSKANWIKRIPWPGLLTALIMAIVVVGAIYKSLFGPKIDIVVQDIDWEPKSPRAGEVVKFTAKFTGIYTVREFSTRYSTQVRQVADKEFADTFHETWSLGGSENERERPYVIKSGTPVESHFDFAFSKAGDYFVVFTVKPDKIEDNDPGNSSIRRAIFVLDTK
jgi:hypothetical protein